jgi:hypothetical protein
MKQGIAKVSTVFKREKFSESLCKLVCRLQLTSHQVKIPQPKQHLPQLLRVATLLAQMARPPQDMTDVHAGKAPDHAQGLTQDDVHGEFPPVSVGRRRKRCQSIDPED